ncbi:MAG: BlaI/MecI/CopY family transcriptional regulator [Pseudomonadota bacterium]|nr:BlaI/MecI/CopY family transcriptional regulator [Pseudomonadota bacterium]
MITTLVVGWIRTAMERISEAEAAVMMVLWDQSPLTAQDVIDRVPAERGWSANTVKTLLARLVAKKAVAHEANGRRYLYRPLIARGDYVTGESRRLIDRLFGGRVSPLVAHLAQRDALSAEEIAEIEALLKDLKA